MQALILASLAAVAQQAPAAVPPLAPPYQRSAVIASITWHWETHRTAALGSDLWPVTWGADGHLYTAWGDGGGFGGTDQVGRVALGFGRLEGFPPEFRMINLNGGKDPEQLAAFPKRGKTGGLLSASAVLYAWVNLQNASWPDVDEELAWSSDRAATWHASSWVFPKGDGNFKPSTFLNFGRDGSGVPRHLNGFAYFYGPRQGRKTETYLGRVPLAHFQERSCFQFCCGLAGNQPLWSTNLDQLQPVFVDFNGVLDLVTVTYHPVLKRFLLTTFHRGPGQLGIFEGPQPWGPWTTVAYYEDWGQMGVEGDGLTCSFPQKWMSADGLTLWCIFSAYGEGAKQGIQAHDRFNLVKASLKLFPQTPSRQQ